jgi:hypothetical protein
VGGTGDSVAVLFKVGGTGDSVAVLLKVGWTGDSVAALLKVGGTGDILALLLRVGRTGDSLAELREVPVELEDEPLLTVLDVARCFWDTPKDLQFVDEPCCLEVLAFWN